MDWLVQLFKTEEYHLNIGKLTALFVMLLGQVPQPRLDLLALAWTPTQPHFPARSQGFLNAIRCVKPLNLSFGWSFYKAPSWSSYVGHVKRPH